MTELETREGLHKNPADTEIPPPNNHGFLEQFEGLTHSYFEDLKSVVELGIVASERMMLIKVSLKLLVLSMHDAKKEDFTPEMVEELDRLILELSTLPIHQ